MSTQTKWRTASVHGAWRRWLLAVSMAVALGCGDDDGAGAPAPEDAATGGDAGAIADAAAADAVGVDPADAAADAGDDPCRGVSAAGCCAGTVVVFCERGGLQQIECEPYACGWSAANGFYKCNGMDDPPADSPPECPPGVP